MAGAFNDTGQSAFGVLLHPSSVSILNLFRLKSELEITHNVSLVEQAEEALSQWTTAAFAKSVVAEAVLLAFSLSRERKRPLEYRSTGSRLTSTDERRLIALVSAYWAYDPLLASAETCVALGVPANGLSHSAAAGLASQIDQAGLRWPSFDLVREPASEVVLDDVVLSPSSGDDAAFKFKT